MKTYKHVSPAGTLILSEQDLQIQVGAPTESVSNLRRDGRIEQQLYKSSPEVIKTYVKDNTAITEEELTKAQRCRDWWLYKAIMEVRANPSTFEIPGA